MDSTHFAGPDSMFILSQHIFTFESFQGLLFAVHLCMGPNVYIVYFGQKAVFGAILGTYKRTDRPQLIVVWSGRR